jgi:hypothetical protein
MSGTAKLYCLIGNEMQIVILRLELNQFVHLIKRKKILTVVVKEQVEINSLKILNSTFFGKNCNFR